VTGLVGNERSGISISCLTVNQNQQSRGAQRSSGHQAVHADPGQKGMDPRGRLLAEAVEELFSPRFSASLIRDERLPRNSDSQEMDSWFYPVANPLFSRVLQQPRLIAAVKRMHAATLYAGGVCLKRIGTGHSLWPLV
jgi:hypothetical protein